jgi:hypothetical protein
VPEIADSAWRLYDVWRAAGNSAHAPEIARLVLSAALSGLQPGDGGQRGMSPTPETERNTVKHLRAREAQILVLLLAGRTFTEICEAIPISRTALWRIRSKPEFEAAFRQAKEELLGGAVAALHNNAMLFVNTLAGVCKDPNARGSEKAQAADRGLSTLLKARELFDIEQRLQKLEAIAGGRK